jgi:hypothetical protein
LEASLEKLHRFFTVDAAKHTEVFELEHALNRYVLVDVIVYIENLILA